MTDLRKTIAPKSDQLNADDLIGQSRTIKITKVSLCSEAEQPIAVNFEGDGGKPWKPCKSMRRVLVNVWGPDGASFVGRSLTLYRDERVMFGGVAVGGIRITHMSDLDKDVTMALTATRASRKPFTVKPLVALKTDSLADALATDAEKSAMQGMESFKAFWENATSAQRKQLANLKDSLKVTAENADKQKPNAEGCSDEPPPPDPEDDPGRFLGAG